MSLGRACAALCASLVFCASLARAQEGGQDGGGQSSSKILQMLGVAGDKSEDGSTINLSAPADSGDGRSHVLQMLMGRGRGKDGKARGIAECPDIVVDGGAAELRSPPGADAASVRYQLSLGRMARDCALHGDDITMRVGLEGSALLGPTGQSGPFFGNLRIAIRRKSDDELIGAKNYKVGANIPAGASRADFSLLVEDLSAPFISSKAGDDYEVVVGFVQSAAPEPRPAKRRSKGEKGG